MVSTLNLERDDDDDDDRYDGAKELRLFSCFLFVQTSGITEL